MEGIRGLDACHDTVESGYTVKFRSWILEETESVLLNLGKCSKPKGTHKTRMQKRGDKEKPSQREVYRCADWSVPWSG